MGQGMESGRTVSSIPFGFDRDGRPLRAWRKRRDLSLGESFRYPLADGSGIALMVSLPPFLSIMALPVFDMMVHFAPSNALNPISLMIVPFVLPLLVCFVLTVGYILIFLGRILSSSASGEVDHPRLPIWDRVEILEELARWIWAGLIGLAIGGLPARAYWAFRGEVEGADLVVFALLAMAGLSYAQLALMTALLNESLTSAHPVMVVRSMGRIGRGYLGPCLVTSLTLLAIVAAWSAVLLHSPSPGIGLLGLWACWVFTLYSGMMVVRMLGTVYYKNEARLGWFRTTRG